MDCSPNRRLSRASGFSFIEVLIALSILLVGSVSIISLFTIGVIHQTERRIEQRVLQVTPEIMTFVQEEVDKAPPGRLPKDVKEHPLSLPGYTVDVRWSGNTMAGESAAGVFAHARLRYRGNPLRTLKPIARTRSTLDPTAKSAGDSPREPR